MDPHEAYRVLIGAAPYAHRYRLRIEHGEALLEWIDRGGYLPGELNHLSRPEARGRVMAAIAYAKERQLIEGR